MIGSVTSRNVTMVLIGSVTSRNVSMVLIGFVTSRNVTMDLIGSVTSRNVTLVELHFIDNICQIFEDFLKLFQSDEPQIHRLYNLW
jgi:hypothetical protein